MTILRDYEVVSGQKVNMGKSSISFEPSMLPTIRGKIVHIGDARAKVEERIRGWKGKLLSEAGREVMIKSVVGAIPNFVMNRFKLPVGIIDALNSLMAKFFWASSYKERGWRVATNQASLLAKLLNGRYYRRSSFLHAKLGTNPSFGWRSLLEGRKILKRGVRWRVGNGKRIDIWKDPWIPRLTELDTRGMEVEGLHKVSQLIQEGNWHESLIGELFEEEDAKRILAIPLSRHHYPSKLVWDHTNSGIYLISSDTNARET
ncbi:hypothetical protein LIER_15464 [Lithospermum erythrorhizon]|uniref:Reverse transcriptase n=1 Tax=Lithospermum erythrorhizon TaxID=34254 RepID=A0AAV3Q8A9_LITER